MSKNTLTEKTLKRIKTTQKEVTLSDGNGLYLRVRPAGDKLWLFRYTNPLGKQAKISFGPYPEVSLDLARQKAIEHKQKLALGIDPKPIERGSPQTVFELFYRWINVELPKRRTDRNVYQTRLRIEKHVIPYIGESALTSLTKPDLLAIFTRLVNKGFNAQANLLFRNLQQMFDYAVHNQWIEFNILKSIEKKEVGGKDKIGTRILSRSEIKELWYKTNQKTGITVQCYISIWLALSTMARIEEMLTAEEADFDLDTNTWKIPANKNQSKRDHIIYLSPFARKLVDTLFSTPREGSTYLFKSNRSKSHVLPKTINFQISHRQDSLDGLDKNSRLSPHLKSTLILTGGRWSHLDLRRTAAALMSASLVHTDTIECCLNRTPKNALVSVYQYESQIAQKRAFNKLGKELEKLTSKK